MLKICPKIYQMVDPQKQCNNVGIALDKVDSAMREERRKKW